METKFVDEKNEDVGKLVVIDVNPRRSLEASRSDGCI
jgi:hypothetical protein